jgi:cell division septation protein DedD
VSRRSSLLPTALLFLALLPASPWAQEAEQPEELLRRAETLAAEGDAGAAVALYREWLLANGDAQEFAQVLSRAADAASEVNDALRLLAEFAPRVREAAAREALLERQAALLRLSGRIEEALVVQIGLPETPSRLVERAGLCLELGLRGEAEQILQRVRESADAEAAAAARVLLARVYLATERAALAEAELRGLLRDQPETQAVPAALLALGETLRECGDDKGAAQALAELKARFPASPESLLAGAPGARHAALPQRLLPPTPQPQLPAEEATPKLPIPQPPDTAGLAPPPLAVPAEGAAQPEPRKALVQAGSFRDPENAHYLARDLGARGFEARVVEKPLGGIRYYRVVVGPEQTPQEAQTLILRLKDAGYEGFLLLE